MKVKSPPEIRRAFLFEPYDSINHSSIPLENLKSLKEYVIIFL